jgi:hypothetical protein
MILIMVGLLSHSPATTSGVARDDHPSRSTSAIDAGNEVPPHSKPNLPQETISNCAGNLRCRILAARCHTDFMQQLYTTRNSSLVARWCRPAGPSGLHLLQLETGLETRFI